jgi:hypothetical protein
MATKKTMLDGDEKNMPIGAIISFYHAENTTLSSYSTRAGRSRLLADNWVCRRCSTGRSCPASGTCREWACPALLDGAPATAWVGGKPHCLGQAVHQPLWRDVAVVPPWLNRHPHDDMSGGIRHDVHVLRESGARAGDASSSCRWQPGPTWGCAYTLPLAQQTSTHLMPPSDPPPSLPLAAARGGGGGGGGGRGGGWEYPISKFSCTETMASAAAHPRVNLKPHAVNIKVTKYDTKINMNYLRNHSLTSSLVK